MALVPRRQRFVDEYLVDLNATQAAIRAGYAAKDADVQGPWLLKEPEVAAAIAERMRERSAKTEVTAERVVAELAKMAFANLADYTRVLPDGSAVVDLTAMTRDQAAALTEIAVEEYVEGRGDAARDVKRVKVKMASKQDALQLLGRHLGMFTDKVDVNLTHNLAARLKAARDRATTGRGGDGSGGGE